MASTGTILFLCLIQASVVAVGLWEKNWPRALFFAAAILMNLAVIWATRMGGK
jgi:hypothetical protein